MMCLKNIGISLWIVLLGSVFIPTSFANDNTEEKALIHRVVLANDLVWIVKHPSGVDVFDRYGKEPELPQNFSKHSFVDIAVNHNNRDTSLVLFRSQKGLDLYSFDENRIDSFIQSVKLETKEQFIRLISCELGRFILTSHRVINLENPRKPKRIKYKSIPESEKEWAALDREFLVSNHVVINNILVLGVTKGEFGGGSLKVNLDTGKVECNGLGCVTDLLIDKNNNQQFYVSTGVTHIGSSGGDVSIVDRTYVEPIFLGNDYLFKLLNMKSNAHFILVSEGIPITGLFYKGDDLYAISEQSYIFNLTSPDKEQIRKIEYQKVGNYYVHWISDEIVIVNFDFFLPFIQARAHTRYSEYSAEDVSLIHNYINQTIIVARKD